MIQKLLPSQNITYHSNLTPTAVMERLEDHVAPQKSLGLGAHRQTHSKPYTGKIWEKNFQIRRVISYRNSFLPQIKGTVTQKNHGSQIDVQMQLQDSVRIFMLLWFGGVCLAGIAIPVGMYFENTLATAGFALWIPVFMLIMGAAMTHFGFKAESAKSMAQLEEILNAEVAAPSPIHTT